MSRSGAVLCAMFLGIMLFAGCLEGDGGVAKDQDKSAKGKAGAGGIKGGLPESQFGPRVQVYDKDGVTPLDLPAFPAPINLTSHSVGVPCGEPTGGITWKNDWVWQVCLARVFVSKDHGLTWTQSSTQASSPTTLDPYMWVDTYTDRVYSVQLYVGCSYLAYSDDYGANWIVNPAACGLPVNDHQTMAGGPPAPPLVSNPVYRNHLYYCVNQLADTMCARSFDGGLTWTGTIAQLTARDIETGNQCSAINGHVVVGKDGTAYLPKRMCNRPIVLVSTDNGITWTERIISRAHAVVQSLAHDPTVTTDAAGNAYYYFTGDDGILRMSVSKNKGGTWSAPVRASPPGMTMSLFETSVAGDEGYSAVAYFGTNEPRQSWKYSSQAPNTTVWNLYLTITRNGLDENPLFTTIQVNPEGDPIQRGCVWLQGGGNACRNLLDFFDISMGKDGRVYVHYADGCMNECVTWKEGQIRRSSTGHVAILQSGPGLFKETDWLTPFAQAAATAKSA